MTINDEKATSLKKIGDINLAIETLSSHLCSLSHRDPRGDWEALEKLKLSLRQCKFNYMVNYGTLINGKTIDEENIISSALSFLRYEGGFNDEELDILKAALVINGLRRDLIDE